MPASIYSPLGAPSSVMSPQPTSSVFAPGTTSSTSEATALGSPGVKGKPSAKLQSMLGIGTNPNMSLLNFAGPGYMDMLDQYQSGLYPDAGFF